MFSPYYAWAPRQTSGGAADSAAHCTLNVVLYERQSGGGRWAMTERGRSQLDRSATRLAIGPSALHWQGDQLRIAIDEVTALIPPPARQRDGARPLPLRPNRHPCPGHRRCLIAPMARVEVDLGTIRWQGAAYFDANHGDAALERGFDRWEWSRATTQSGDALVFYDAEPLHGAPFNLGLRFRRNGGIDEVESPPTQALPLTGWRIRRHGRSDAGILPTVLQTLTDAPFCARSLLGAQWQSEAVVAMHESLSLKRVARPWLQAMLPLRMPRRGG